MGMLPLELYKRLKRFQFDHIYYDLQEINETLQRSSGNYVKDFTLDIRQTLDDMSGSFGDQIMGTYIDNGVYYVFFSISVCTRSNRYKFYNQSAEAFKHLADNKIMLQIVDPANLGGVVYASIVSKDRIHLNIIVTEFEDIKNRFLREGFENFKLKHEEIFYRCVYCCDTPEGFCVNLRRLR